jgi:hypothetical protein
LARIKLASCAALGSFGQDAPRGSSSYNQCGCDSALIVNNRKIYNDFSAVS